MIVVDVNSVTFQLYIVPRYVKNNYV